MERVGGTVIHRVRVTVDGSVPAIPLTVTAHNRVVATPPRAYRTRAPFSCGDGSGVVLPGPWSELAHPIPLVLAGVHQAASMQDPVVMIVGHAAKAEDPALAAARVTSLRCIVDDDVDAWVKLATDTGSIRDIKAYFQYLNAILAWECHVDAVDATTGPSTEESVGLFQAEYNRVFERSIRVDGICGDDTLEAIFRVLRYEWEKWLVKHDVTQETVDEVGLLFVDGSLGDPSSPALAMLEGRACVEVLLVERADLGGASETPDAIYDSKCVRFEPFDVPLESFAWMRGNYTIVTDLIAGEVVPKERYTLRASDGSYELTQTIPDDAIDAGLLELRFLGLPCEASYGLSVTINDGETYQLFSGVPYNKLHRLAVEGPEDG